MRLRPWIVMLSVLLMVIAAPVDARKKGGFEDTARGYAKMVRWNEWESAFEYLSPEYIEANPVTELQRERLNMLRVTGYEELSRRTISKTEIEQLVEIRVVNQNTQQERTLRDRQTWRYDAKAKRWWLVSGLPDFSPKP